MPTEPPKLHDLVSLPLWAIGRAAELIWFQFGEQKQLAAVGRSSQSEPRIVGDFALHVQCPWRLRVGDRILVGDHDLWSPRDVTTLAGLPESFDPKLGLTRLDQLVEHVHRRHLPAVVQKVSFRGGLAFTLELQADLCLDVFPNATIETEFWRLFVPGDEEREHHIAESLGADAPLNGATGAEAASLLHTGPYRAAHASIRFAAETLDPLVITKLLRMPCDHSHRKGEPRLSRQRITGRIREYSPYRQGQWSMSSEDFVISDDLNQHILWVLAQLEPRSAEVRELVASGVDGDIFCYALGTAQPAVPETTIARASALGLTVDIDFYESSDEEDE